MREKQSAAPDSMSGMSLNGFTAISRLCARTRTRFLFHDPPTTEIYTLSLHDALPISRYSGELSRSSSCEPRAATRPSSSTTISRSEEHTSELQSRENRVCRLLLEKKKKATDASMTGMMTS